MSGKPHSTDGVSPAVIARREYMRDYYRRNPERMKAKRERDKATMTPEERERRRAYAREYRRQHQDQIAAYNREYKKAHPQRQKDCIDRFFERKAAEKAAREQAASQSVPADQNGGGDE